MPSNKGKLIEDEMMLALNNHFVKDLSPNLRNVMHSLFGALEANEIVTCTQPDVPIKPDLLITYKGKTKGLSLKSGASEYVHGEPIDKFVDFLRNLNISRETIETILLYQFGDGTIDGSGKERMELEQLKTSLYFRLKKANSELNRDPNLILKIIDRFLFQGWDLEAKNADAIYHGDIYFGISITKRQITKYINVKVWDYYDSLHIGPVFLRPHARYIGVEIKSEFSRHKIDGFWPNMLSDMNYISKRFFAYTPLNKRKFEE